MMTKEGKIRDNAVSLHGIDSCVGGLDSFETISDCANFLYPRMKVAKTLTKW